MNKQEIARLCEEHIGKTYKLDNEKLIYKHGKAVSMTATSVKIGFYGVEVRHYITFSDGYQDAPDSYSCDGLGFLLYIGAINHDKLLELSNN